MIHHGYRVAGTAEAAPEERGAVPGQGTGVPTSQSAGLDD